MIDSEELSHRFAYHPPKNDKTIRAHEAVRTLLDEAADRLNEIVPDGREKALVMTNLEQAMMWANAGIARIGLE